MDPDKLMEPTPNTNYGFQRVLGDYTPIQLVSMRNAIETELRHRHEALSKELEATARALGDKPKRQRAPRISTKPRRRAKPIAEPESLEKGDAS